MYEEPRTTRMEDIARRAGVSRATVSRAFTGHPKCASGTRERITAIAREMGFVPNPVAAHLARQRRSGAGRNDPVLAFVSDDESEYGKELGETDFLPAQQRAGELGYRLDYFSLWRSGGAGRLREILRSRGIRGVILDRAFHTKMPEKFEWDGFTLVGCGFGSERQPIHTVGEDPWLGVRLAYQKVRELGYARIGMAPGRHDFPVEDDAQREAASWQCLHTDRSLKSHLPVFCGPLLDRDTFMRWFEKHRPDAVIAFHAGVYWWIKDSGIKIPREVGFACLRNVRNIRNSSIAGIAAAEDQKARIAVELLDRELLNHSLGLPTCPLSIFVAPQWVEGKTLRPQPKGG